jgi:predicted AlkP superfamily pyrophosphatase or phosphodiesterase
MRRFQLKIFIAATSLFSVLAVAIASSGGINSAEHINKPSVLMISIDGFRFDYIEKFGAENLAQIAAQGVRAESMKPSFPSLTFPNHITLVTGRYPGNHGIVSNTFYDEDRHEKYSIGDGKTVRDSSWYLSDALWTIAERAGMVSGIYFWVGSESKIGGVDPTYFMPYSDDAPNADRVAKIKEWLMMPEERRPHLLGLYFSDVDSAGHKFGTDAEETKAAVLSIDGYVGELDRFITEHNLNVNIIVVSDHGMQNLDTKKVVELGLMADLSQFTWGDKGAVVNLYSDDEANVQRAFMDLKLNEEHYKVYRRHELPENYRYAHPTRVGDLVVVAEMPYYLLDKVTPEKPLKLNRATHGWDPINQNMHALFIAKGPQIKSGLTISTFENVNVFPLVLDILGLEAKAPHDGDAEVLKPILKTN